MKRYLNRIAGKQKAVIAFCFLLFAFSLLAGCKKFLEIPPPNTQVVSSQVFNTAATATAAQTAIYQQMFNGVVSYDVALENGLLSDELINYSTSASQLAYYHNAMSTVYGYEGDWTDYYQFIYDTNAVIAGLQNNTAISAKIANQLTGEAKFTRAFIYFYLVNIYGDVPLATTPLYTTNANLSRSPKALVYQQMVNDLTDAETLLNPNYVDASDTATTMDRVRPNQAAAAALLARVYLYMGKYSQAISEATKVINNPLYQLVSPLTQTNYVFNISDNSEAIWQIAQAMPPSLNGATPDGNFFILSSKPTNVSLSTRLISSFEPGDQRFNVWVGTYNTGGVTYYYPAKYKVSSFNADPNNITEYMMMLRLAEQYLIRAEAEANNSDPSDAVKDLNVIRSRAGLPNYAGATDPASLLAAILHERQVEFFAEWGHRWFDLIRTGNVNSVMSVVAPQKGGVWKPTDALYPIPLQEISRDPKLTQNAGY